MGDPIDRLESARALYMRGSRQQLVEIIRKYNPQIITGAIARALELQIIAEEIALEKGIDIDEAAIAEYTNRNREKLSKDVELALTSFISSIVSQEG